MMVIPMNIHCWKVVDRILVIIRKASNLGNVIDKFTIGGKKDLYSTKGFFGRVNYSYNDTYFGNVSYRRDASSRFAPENRLG